MTCKYAITSVPSTLNTIYLSTTILNESTFTYYDDKNEYFESLFQRYKDSDVNNIYHPALTEEWKANMDRAAYEYNLHKYV